MNRWEVRVCAPLLAARSTTKLVIFEGACVFAERSSSRGRRPSQVLKLPLLLLFAHSLSPGADLPVRLQESLKREGTRTSSVVILMVPSLRLLAKAACRAREQIGGLAVGINTRGRMRQFPGDNEIRWVDMALGGGRVAQQHARR